MSPTILSTGPTQPHYEEIVAAAHMEKKTVASAKKVAKANHRSCTAVAVIAASEKNSIKIPVI